MTAPARIVVVGASLAGLRAVETARSSGFDGELTLVGEEVHLPYDRPPLSKELLAPGELSTAHEFPDLQRRLHDELGVRVLTGHRAMSLDLSEGSITVRDADGTMGKVDFDAALIATGVRPRSLQMGDHLRGVHRLRTLEDALAIRAALDEGARTVIIGAGFIGAEVASAARARGLHVTMLEAATAPLVRAVGTTAGQHLSGLHQQNGTELHCGQIIADIVGDERVRGVRLSDGTELPADLVVIGIGADPCVEWLEGSGVPVGNGVVCDERLQSTSRVWAAGDVARWHNPLFQTSMRLEHWTNAGDQGAHAMRNLLDPAHATAYDHVPYFWSDWYGRRIQFAGVACGEPELAFGNWDGPAFVALYREQDRIVGALTLDRRGDIMKYRGLIGRRGSWDDALALAAQRAAGSASVPA